jgi:hypothetical protein
VLGVVFSAGIVSTTVLSVSGQTMLTASGAVLTAVVGFFLYRSFQTGINLYARSDAQFTRQRLRDGDDDEAAMGFGEALTDEEGNIAAHEAMPTPGLEDDTDEAGTTGDAEPSPSDSGSADGPPDADGGASGIPVDADDESGSDDTDEGGEEDADGDSDTPGRDRGLSDS